MGHSDIDEPLPNKFSERELSADGPLFILDGMWQTSIGTRTLAGSEAELVRQLLGYVYYQISVTRQTPGEPFESGVSLFDRLEAPQQLALLAEVGQALLRRDQPAPKLTSLREATVAVLYEQLRSCVEDEIDREQRDQTPRRYWRTLIWTACIREEEAEGLADLPAPDSDGLDAWDLIIEVLADRILWDRDWEMEDLFADAIPERGRQLKQFLGIDDGYFRDIAPDPTEQQLAAVRSQLDALVRAVP